MGEHCERCSGRKIKKIGVNVLITRPSQSDRYSFHSSGLEWSWREVPISSLESLALLYTEVQRKER